jgi:hypothetical protein
LLGFSFSVLILMILSENFASNTFNISFHLKFLEFNAKTEPFCDQFDRILRISDKSFEYLVIIDFVHLMVHNSCHRISLFILKPLMDRVIWAFCHNYSTRNDIKFFEVFKLSRVLRETIYHKTLNKGIASTGSVLY